MHVVRGRARHFSGERGRIQRILERNNCSPLCVGHFCYSVLFILPTKCRKRKGQRALLLILGSDRKSAMPFPHLSLHPESPTHWWKETTMVSFSSRGLFRAHMPRKWLHQIVRAEFPAVGEGRNNIICYESGAERVPLCLVNRNEPPIFPFLFLNEYILSCENAWNLLLHHSCFREGGCSTAGQSPIIDQGIMQFSTIIKTPLIPLSLIFRSQTSFCVLRSHDQAITASLVTDNMPDANEANSTRDEIERTDSSNAELDLSSSFLTDFFSPFCLPITQLGKYALFSK